jgi:hypothetical protein
MSEHLGRYEVGFASWSRVLSLSATDEARLGNFRNLCNEAVGYVDSGLERGEAVDELFKLADAHGLLEEVGRENIEAIITTAFERPVEEPPKLNGGQEPPQIRQATPYVAPNEHEIVPRAWLHAGHYIRQAATATVAPGGFGKTTLTIHEAIAMVANGLRVWYLSGEDPKVELDRRIAAHCKHHKIDLASLPGRLFVDDRSTFPLTIATATRPGVIKFDEASLLQFEHAIMADEIAVTMLDPFIAFHTVAENDNGSIDAVVKRLAAIAQRTDSCIEISHHVRKSFNGQGSLTVEDARGGSALINAVRSARVINRMTQAEAEQAAIRDTDQRHFYVRVDRGKRNMAPPDRATWLHLVSVYLLNGDNVQALEPWEFPKVGKPAEADKEWLRSVVAAQPDQRMGRDKRMGDEWIGYALATHFDRDPEDETDAKWIRSTIKYFVDEGVIKPTKARNAEYKERRYYELKDGPPKQPHLTLVPDDDD